jgi:hypothetical protein
LRLIVRQTARGEKLDTDLVERAKAIVERYDRATLKGHDAPNIVPLPAAMTTVSRAPTTLLCYKSIDVPDCRLGQGSSHEEGEEFLCGLWCSG